MNKKIKNYVDVLFGDVPKTKKSQELKEEILANMSDRFDGYIAQGKSENQAYSQSVTDLGDIDEMLSSIAPERELKPKIDEYRVRRARNIAIAVAMYILGVIMLISLGALPGILGFYQWEDAGGVVGLICLLSLAAGATALIIYTTMSVPQDVAPYLQDDDDDEKIFKGDSSQRALIYSSILKFYWLAVVALYLLISFRTFQWHITWIIFPVAAIFAQGIKILYTMGRKNGDGK
ncbi:MAG TPA: permease prefix domain 1-containing protein [Treponemataceae bacterium]|nr:permease prefix domain 1-containing protein [Treponemataceae bacterium]HQL04766.1 permease prefix domain 1-containing protein [Treponemataceae bacterium]